MSNCITTPADITIVATHTIDSFPPDERGNRRSMAGGPAHYITTALDQLDVPYRLVTGPPCEVDVLPRPWGEEYLIPPIPLIPLPDPLSGPAVILSPIAREIDPRRIPGVEGILAIDLQGFVRHPGRPTTELDTVDLSPLMTRAQVVKASQTELEHLDPASLEALDSMILLTTHGEKGASVRIRGERHFVASHPVNTPHTIGAGDTYLAAFTVFLLGGADPLGAAEQAARFTERMLTERAAASTQSR